MRKRSLAETLVFVNLLFTSCLSVRACSGVHDRVRGCFGGVRVMFRYRSGSVRVVFGLLVLAVFVYIVKNNTVYTLSVAKSGQYYCLSHSISITIKHIVL